MENKQPKPPFTGQKTWKERKVREKKEKKNREKEREKKKEKRMSFNVHFSYFVCG